MGWHYNPGSGELFSAVAENSVRPADFKTFAEPVAGSKALFMLRDNSGAPLLSTNPYALTSLGKPYDGNTRSWQLMGYVIENGQQTGDHDYVNLQQLLGQHFSADQGDILAPK